MGYNILLATVWERESSLELIRCMEYMSVCITTLCFATLIFEKMSLCCLCNDIFASSGDFDTFFGS